MHDGPCKGKKGQVQGKQQMCSGNESYPHLVFERAHGIFNSHSLVHELQRHPCSSPVVGQLRTPLFPVWDFKMLSEALLLSLQIVVLC